MHDFFTTTAACGSAVFDGQPQDLTAGAEIYGGKGEIEESMTSTRINIPAVQDNQKSASPRPLALAGL